MAKSPCRRPDHRPVKIHRTYSIEEAARTLNVHKNTIRAWIRNGLQLVDRRKPFLIHGQVLITYVQVQNAGRKRPCGPGEIYCPPCRATKNPAGAMADYFARTTKTGDLVGLCPHCTRLMYRRVSWARLEEVRGALEVQIMEPHVRISEGACLSVSSDFDKE